MKRKKKYQSLGDYVAVAFSPFLIMALVGSLVFFQAEVFYNGQYTGRLLWMLFWFVIGMVGIARIQIEGGNIRRYSFVAWAHLLKPEAIVTSQRFPNCEARQSGAIALLDLPLIAQLIELHLSDCREPPTEVVTILKRMQFDSVGDAVVIRVD